MVLIRFQFGFENCWSRVSGMNQYNMPKAASAIAAGVPKDQRIMLILKAHWNKALSRNPPAHIGQLTNPPETGSISPFINPKSISTRYAKKRHAFHGPMGRSPAG
jgi:hypothetical protein